MEAGDEVKMNPDNWDENSICDLEEVLTVIKVKEPYIYLNHPLFSHMHKRYLILHRTKVEARKGKIANLIQEE